MTSATGVLERSVTEVPLYTALDAGRYLHVPVWVAFSVFDRSRIHPMEWVERYWHDPSFRASDTDDYGPLIHGDEVERISFRSIATLFVVSAPFLWLLSTPRFPLRKSFGHLLESFRPTPYDPRMLTEPDWVLSQFGHWGVGDLEDFTSQLRKTIALHQSRIESNENGPVRLFPFTREPAVDAPRVVVLDPEIRFGRPTVRGVPTDVLADRWRAGDGVADLAEDYGLTTDEVEEALRSEAPPAQPQLFPFPPFVW